MYPPDPTVDLLVAARRGEQDAVRALLVRYGPMVWGLCLSLDPQPEDAYQDVWEHILRGLASFDPAGRAAFSTWMYSVAHHRLVDRERRRRVRARIEPLSGDVADERDLHGALEASEGRARLLSAVARLPEAQRRAVLFHYLDEVPLPELAAAEGVPVGTLKSRLHQARARLLELLRGTR